MNITSYLPDELVKALDAIGREQHRSRSALIRDALEAYLQRFRPGAWPDEVMSWQADNQFPSFESLRGPSDQVRPDPFGLWTP